MYISTVVNKPAPPPPRVIPNAKIGKIRFITKMDNDFDEHYYSEYKMDYGCKDYEGMQ